MEGDVPSIAVTGTQVLISTHALTWRATCWGLAILSETSDFYPRPHMEGDGQWFPKGRLIALISTHALTWRATGLMVR